MATSKKKDNDKPEQPPVQHDRSYFFLNEMAPFGYSVDALLDLGVSQKLTLSFVVAGRSVISGDYLDEEGEVECPQADGVFSGLMPIIQEYIWRILADGRATIEYTHKTETDFARIQQSESDPLPVITRDQVLIAARDWKLFIDGMPPDPISPPDLIHKTKKSETLTIGALTYLYAREKQNKGAYFKQNGDIYIERVTDDVVQILHNGLTHHPGASDTTVQGLISAALKVVTPIQKANAEKSTSGK